MSSPITFSGFNDIDFNSVLNALMNQASLPLTTLQARQNELKSQVTSFDALKARVSSIKSSADQLSTLSAVSTLSATTSNSSVTASASNAAQAGHYDVVVNELARAQVTVSGSSFADANTTVVANGGTITVGGATVTLSGPTTLQGLADAINAAPNSGVSASVIRSGTNTYRLAVSSTVSGTANAFTITNALTGGVGVAFTDTDNDGTSGDSAADNAVTATDASIVINGITATSSTNTFADVATGLTVTVSKKDPATTVSVDVAPNGSALESKLEAFISAYNDTVAYLETQRVSASNGDSRSIGLDPLLRQLRNSLRTELLGAHGTGTFTRLTEVGIEFERDGTLSLNKTMFNAAVASDGNGVRQLFAGTSGSFPAVKALLDTYSNATGYISTAQTKLNSQVDLMDRQIESLQLRLQLQRETLQRQFTEADTAMSRLKSQSASLSQFSTSLF